MNSVNFLLLNKLKIKENIFFNFIMINFIAITWIDEMKILSLLKFINIVISILPVERFI